MFTTDDESPNSEELELPEPDSKEVQKAEVFNEFWSDPCWSAPLDEASKK
jgi:hypothetical protein